MKLKKSGGVMSKQNRRIHKSARSLFIYKLADKATEGPFKISESQAIKFAQLFLYEIFNEIENRNESQIGAGDNWFRDLNLRNGYRQKKSQKILERTFF